MKNLIKKFLIKISRIIFFLTPEEFVKKENSSLMEMLIKEKDRETFNIFSQHIKKSIIFTDQFSLRKYAIQSALENDKNKKGFYLEFGVWKGKSANFLSRFVEKLYVFDSFQGLNEDWPGTEYEKGAFNLEQKIPKLNKNIEAIPGWVEDTLDNFINKYNPDINFIHIDLDCYSPTKFTLKKVKPYLKKGAYIVFDELYNFIGWEEGEYRALKEVFNDDEYEFKAFDINGAAVVIQLK